MQRLISIVVVSPYNHPRANQQTIDNTIHMKKNSHKTNTRSTNPKTPRQFKQSQQTAKTKRPKDQMITDQ